MSTANIKSITNLKGDLSDSDWNFSLWKGTSEQQQTGNGIMRSIQHSSQGILFCCGEVFLSVSQSELWKLAESLEPGLNPPKPKEWVEKPRESSGKESNGNGS